MRIQIAMDERLSRPVLLLDELFIGCRALFDSGALFPVWVLREGSEDQSLANLKELNATQDSKLPSSSLSGIGGEKTGNIYRLNLNLHGIFYINMPIMALPMKSAQFDLILPATMFQDMDLSISFQKHVFELDTLSNQVAYNLQHRRDDNGQLTVYTQ